MRSGDVALNPISLFCCALAPCPAFLTLTPPLTAPLPTHSSSRAAVGIFWMMYMICSLLLLVLAACFVILTAFHEQFLSGTPPSPTHTPTQTLNFNP